VRRSIPVLLQLAGVVTMAVGFGLLATWAGVMVGGLGLVAVGVVGELAQPLPAPTTEAPTTEKPSRDRDE